jgi:uncharacterized membrane protein HdeD (DUF308 family)
MTKHTSTNFMMVNSNLLGSSSKNWKWLLIIGVLFVILGTSGIGMAASVTLVSVTFFAWLLLFGGLLLLLQALTLDGVKHRMMQILVALLYAFSGALIVFNPEVGAGAITALIAMSFIALGLVRIIMSMMLKYNNGRVWLGLSGIISVGLGVYILINLAQSAMLIIGLLISIEMLIAGWSFIMLALMTRRISKSSSE